MRGKILKAAARIGRIPYKLLISARNVFHLVTRTGYPEPAFGDPDRINVLIMIDSLGGGGAERVACQLASGLADSCNVALLYSRERENEYPVDSRVQRIQMPIFSFGCFLAPSSAYVREIKRRFHIDVSISLLHFMNCRNVYSKGRERVIVSERNNPQLGHPEKYAASKVIYDRADHVVFQTREVQAMFSEKTQRHSSILPNPVSVTCLAGETRTKRIVHAARLHANKNQALLLRAFALFLPAHPGYTLSLYGEGPLEAKLRAQAEALGIRDQVFFHGNVKDIHERMADAGMFVLSSNAEGMPNALLEAMMMGLPCISTACTGAKEVLHTGENGILTKLGDAEDLAAAMAWMADHPEDADRMRRNAMRTAEAFRKEKVMKQWEALVMEPFGEPQPEPPLKKDRTASR